MLVKTTHTNPSPYFILKQYNYKNTLTKYNQLYNHCIEQIQNNPKKNTLGMSTIIAIVLGLLFYSTLLPIIAITIAIVSCTIWHIIDYFTEKPYFDQKDILQDWLSKKLSKSQLHKILKELKKVHYLIRKNISKIAVKIHTSLSQHKHPYLQDSILSFIKQFSTSNQKNLSETEYIIFSQGCDTLTTKKIIIHTNSISEYQRQEHIRSYVNLHIEFKKIDIGEEIDNIELFNQNESEQWKKIYKQCLWLIEQKIHPHSNIVFINLAKLFLFVPEKLHLNFLKECYMGHKDEDGKLRDISLKLAIENINHKIRTKRLKNIKYRHLQKLIRLFSKS